MLERLVSACGDLALSEITSWHVEKYKAARKDEIGRRDSLRPPKAKQFSLATVNRELTCLKHLFNNALEWGTAEKRGVVPVNDCLTATLKRIKKNDARTANLILF